MPRSFPFLFRSAQEWALFGVTVFWGGTFIVVRLAMEQSGPLFFVGLRFGAAALIMLALAAPSMRHLTRRELLGGMAIGVTTFLGFALQTMGLVTIEAAKSAFITAFYVPLVPLFEWLIMRRRPGTAALLGVAISFPGVLLLTGGGPGGAMGTGDLLTMACAACFAVEIVITGLIAPGTAVRRITAVELCTITALAFCLMPVAGETVPALTPPLLAMGVGMGIGTSVMQGVIIWGQKRVAPTRATVIYTCEPVWGGVFGRLAGERLPWLALLGCALVLIGVLVGGRGNNDGRGRDRPPAA